MTGSLVDLIKRTRVVTIIVNWNAPEDTVACLDSLINHEECNEIVLIDNGSGDDSVAIFIAWAAKKELSFKVVSTLAGFNTSVGAVLTLLPLQENLGFGVANNLGMEYALRTGADYVLILNNDTVVTPGFLRQLLNTAIRNDRLGIIGCTIRYFDHPDQVWFSGGKIDAFRGAFYHEHNICNGIINTDFVTGCLMLIPCYVLQEIGLFDERFFLNVEDIELSSRISAAGYKLLVDCNTVIFHKVSVSIGGLYSFKNQYYFHRNRFIYFNDRLRGWKKLFFWLLQFGLLIPLWFFYQLINGRISAIDGAVRGYVDLLCGKTGIYCQSVKR